MNEKSIEVKLSDLNLDLLKEWLKIYFDSPDDLEVLPTKHEKTKIFLVNTRSHGKKLIKIPQKNDDFQRELKYSKLVKEIYATSLLFPKEDVSIHALSHSLELIPVDKNFQEHFGLLIQKYAEFYLAEYMNMKMKGEVEIKDFDFLKIIRDVSINIATLHSKKMIHRDIKPSNIVFLNGKWALIDFESALFFPNGEIKEKEKEFPGTLRYFSNIDYKTSIYMMFSLLE